MNGVMLGPDTVPQWSYLPLVCDSGGKWGARALFFCTYIYVYHSFLYSKGNVAIYMCLYWYVGLTGGYCFCF